MCGCYSAAGRAKSFAPVSRPDKKKLWNKIVAKFEPAAAELMAQAKAGDPNAEFGDNVRFWTSTAKLAIALSAIKALPSQWDFAVEALSEAIIEAPAVVLDVTKGIASSVVDVAEAVATGAGRVVGGVGKGFFDAFGLGGIALIAGAAYLYTQRRR